MVTDTENARERAASGVGRPYSRRDLLRMGALGAGALGASPILAACRAGGAAATTTSTRAATAGTPAPAAR